MRPLDGEGLPRCDWSTVLHAPHRLSLWPGVTQIDRVVEAVEETLKGNTVHLLAKKKLPKLDLPKVEPL